MKKVLKLVLVAVLASLTVFGTIACVDHGNGGGKKGLLYKKDADGVYVVYGYKDDGSLVNNTLNIGEKLEVPADAKVRIKSKAFAGNDSIKTLVVSSKVTEIESGAFANMQALETLNVPFIGVNKNSDEYMFQTPATEEKAVDAQRTIAHFFGSEEYNKGCSITINYGAGTTSCYMPSSLKTVVVSPAEDYGIPMYAFNGAVNIEKIVLGDKVNAIGVNAFENTAFGEISIPLSVTKIYEKAFLNARLTKVEFAQGATNIELGSKAFAGCDNLVTIDKTVFKTGYPADAFDAE